MWEAAQTVGTEHSTSRDGLGPSTHPATRRTYVLRSRVRCRSCQRRMSGITRTTTRYWDDGPDYTSTYGPDRRALLEASMPATAADDRGRKEKEAAALNRRLRQIDTAENAQAREIETLAHLTDPNAPALTALRQRILARFTELEDERTRINTQLAGLRKTEPQAGDPALLDALPYLGDILAGAPTHPPPAAALPGIRPASPLQKEHAPGQPHRHHHRQPPHALAAIISNATSDPATTAATEPATAEPHFSDLAEAPMR